MDLDGEDEGHAPARRLRRQQQALAEFGLFAFRTRDLDKLLHRACELVAEGLDVRRTKVLELIDDGTALLVRAGVGWKPGIVGHVTFGAGDESPAGHALDRREAITSPDLDRETRFAIPPMLVEHGIRSMVNVVVEGEDGAFGVLEVDETRPRDFDDDDIAFLRNHANLIAAAIERLRAHDALEDANREQDVLVQELAHRVKNLLGLVQSLTAQTSAEDPAARAFQEVLLGRLQALARAENLVFEDHAQELDLAALAPQVLEPFHERARGDVVIDGPPLLLPARSGRIIALVLNELATNATKHGALARPDGRVTLGWQAVPSGGELQVTLRWVERDGPPVAPPARQGFGTTLLTRLASYELDGEARLSHAAEGLEYRLDFPLDLP